MRTMINVGILGWSVLAASCASLPPANPQQAPTPAAAPKIAGQAPTAPVPLEEYFKILRVATRGAGASFSFDEKLVAFSSDQGGRIDLWVAPVAGGEAKQITHVEGFLHSYAFSPGADVLAFEADQGGNELPHLFLTNSRGDAPKDLCESDPNTARTRFIEWAEDGASFIYLSSRRDEKYLDLYEYSMKTGRSELLWQASGQRSFALASRDHRRFVVAETVSDVDSNLYLVERGEKSAPTLLTPHDGEVAYEPTDFSKDASTLYYVSDEAGEFTALYAMDLNTKRSKVALADQWDVERGEFSNGWHYFVTQTNVDGSPRVVLTETSTGQPVALPSAGDRVTLVPITFSKSDSYLVAETVSEASPATIVVVDLKKGTVTRLVDALPESLRTRTMASASSVRVASFDGREVPAFLYQPQGTGPFPAVIDVHGGPTYQSRREFDPLRQYLVSKGYAVLVPNVRGSTGYGKTYTKLDDLDLGGGPLKDVVACKAWLVGNAKVDPSRVAILGGSYGGYMSLAAATFAPTEFAAHVDYYGVSDLKTLVESFPAYWANQATYIHKKFGDPKNPKHAQYQHDRSPINFIDKISRPLLIVQGENDARVKKDQSDRIVAKLEERGLAVHYLVLRGEGHGFSRNGSRLAAYKATDRFLDRYLFNDASVDVIPQAAQTSADKPEPATAPSVAVLGTVHSFHEKEALAYSYADLGEQIRNMRPDLVCGEITADDYRGERESMYPREVAIVEEAAEAVGATFFPSDWRPESASAETASAQKEMSAEEKKAFDSVYDDFMPRLQESGQKSFEFWHSDDTQQIIRGLHDRMIYLAGDPGAGFWDTRNQMMVKRCMRKALTSGAKRVLFVFGAEHKYITEQYLRRFYGIEAERVTRLAGHVNLPVSPVVLARWTKARDNLARLVASQVLPDYFAETFNAKYVERFTATIEAQGRAR